MQSNFGPPHSGKRPPVTLRVANQRRTHRAVPFMKALIMSKDAAGMNSGTSCPAPLIVTKENCLEAPPKRIAYPAAAERPPAPALPYHGCQAVVCGKPRPVVHASVPTY